MRRAAPGERLTTLDGVEPDAGPGGHGDLPTTPARSRWPRSWAAQTTEVVRRTTTACCSRRRTGTRRWSPGRPAGTSCSARRPSGGSAASTASCCLVAIERGVRAAGRARRAAAPTHGSLDVDYPRRAGDRSRWPPTCPARLVGVAYSAERRGRAARPRSAARSTAPTGRLDRDPAELAARPARPGRPRRGGGPAGRLRHGAQRAADRAARQRADRRASGARRSVGRALAEPGYVEVLSYPFVGAGGLSTRSAWPTTTRAARAAGQPAVRGGAADAHHACCPPLLAALRRNVGRGQRDVALFEKGLVFLPTGPRRRRRCGRATGAPTDEELAARRRAAAPAVARRRPCWPASSSRPAGGARAARRAGPTRSRRPGTWPRAAGCRR